MARALFVYAIILSWGCVASGQQCGSFDTCSNCTTENGCGWCQDSSTCLPGAIGGPAQDMCRDWRWGSYMCSSPAPHAACSQTDCSECVAESECGWCRTDGRCHRKNAAGHVHCSEWYEATCPAPDGRNCELYNSCRYCLSLADCRWCPTAGTCSTLNSSSIGQCGSDIITTYDHCPSSPLNRCGDQTDCYGCLGGERRGRCSWCTANGVCYETNSTNDGCPDGQLRNHTCVLPPVPNSCAAYTKCGECTGAPQGNCGWCTATRACHEGTSTGPAAGSCPTASWEWTSNQCPTETPMTPRPQLDCIAAYYTCEMCTQHPGCGWCDSDNVCYNGDNAGPSNNHQSPQSECAANWRHGRGSCASGRNCSSHTECGSCTSTAGCGWCDQNNVCLPGNEHGPHSGTCGGGSWRLHHCGGVDCRQHSTCDQCAAAAGCGWCSTTSSCTSGVNSGPTDGSVCPDWEFEPMSCDSGCSHFTDCASCVVNDICGWCASSSTCTFATGSVPASGYCPPGDFIEPRGVCPVPCSSFTTCSQCTKESGHNCGWCDTYQQCFQGTDQGPRFGVQCPTMSWSFYSIDCPCNTHKSCYDCTTTERSCGWCGDDQTCYRGNASGPTNATCSTNWAGSSTECPTPAPPGASDCVQWKNCSACTMAPGGQCGWCTSNKLCSQGTSSGSLAGECSGPWEWTPAECEDSGSVALRALSSQKHLRAEPGAIQKREDNVKKTAP